MRILRILRTLLPVQAVDCIVAALPLPLSSLPPSPSANFAPVAKAAPKKKKVPSQVAQTAAVDEGTREKPPLDQLLNLFDFEAVAKSVRCPPPVDKVLEACGIVC